MDRNLFIERMESIFQPISGRSGRTIYTPSKFWGSSFEILYLGFNPGGGIGETIKDHWATMLNDPNLNNYWEAWPRPRHGFYPNGDAPLQRVYFGLRQALGGNEEKILGTNIVFDRSTDISNLYIDPISKKARDEYLSFIFSSLSFHKVIILGLDANNYLRENIFNNESGSCSEQDTKQFLKKNKLRIWEGKYKENTFNCVCIPHPNPRLDSDYGSFDSSKFQLNINKILSYS